MLIAVHSIDTRPRPAYVARHEWLVPFMGAVSDAQKVMHGTSIVRIIIISTGELTFVQIPTVFHAIYKIEIPRDDGVSIVLGSGLV